MPDRVPVCPECEAPYHYCDCTPTSGMEMADRARELLALAERLRSACEELPDAMRAFEDHPLTLGELRQAADVLEATGRPPNGHYNPLADRTPEASATISAAILAEREECARVAETCKPEWVDYHQPPQTFIDEDGEECWIPERRGRIMKTNLGASIAAAIRNREKGE